MEVRLPSGVTITSEQIASWAALHGRSGLLFKASWTPCSCGVMVVHWPDGTHLCEINLNGEIMFAEHLN